MARKPVRKATESTDRTPSEYTAADWLLQMKLADRRNEKWENRCKKIIRRYRNQHIDDMTNGSGGTDRRGMNVLWSNVETLQPSIYSREPVPIAERRFLDRDVTGRIASQLLERSMRYEMGDCGFHDTVEQGVKDYLLVGRGVAWLRFNPIIGKESSLTDRGDDDLNGELGEPDPSPIDPNVEAEDRDGDDPTEESPQEKLLSAGIDVDYVHWSDFLTSKARFWKENEWVARRIYMSKDDVAGEFGEEIAGQVTYEMAPDQEELKSAGHTIDQAPETMRKAIVFEIWHKPTRKVYTVCKAFDKYLEDPREDPLNLEGFWPCPKPLFATMTNDSLEPVPDYLEYQDQALQIDELTNRMSLLVKALKVVGVYDASNKNLARLLDEGNENKLIPVANWAQLSEKGGLAQAVSFVPIKDVADVLLGLTQARDKVKQDMFEITGLADVIRGQSDPRETAAAVSTKGRWGSLRLQARQMAVARFCRDIIRMIGEIIAEHYPPELIVTTSGAMYDDGIGGPAPEPPPKPDMPGIGHNGGPPLAGIGDQSRIPMAGPMPPGGPVGGGGFPHGPMPPIAPGPSGLGGGLPNRPIGGMLNAQPPGMPIAAPQPASGSPIGMHPIPPMARPGGLPQPQAVNAQGPGGIPPGPPMAGPGAAPPIGSVALRPGILSNAPPPAQGVSLPGLHPPIGQQPNALAMASHPGVPPIGGTPASPQNGPPPMAGQTPQISPAVQYAMAMQQYQQKLAAHMAEKEALIMKAIMLLKQDKMRGFRIDIETDSTVQNEANEDKQSRIEFIKATTGFIEQAFQIGAQVPDAAPMLGKLLLFGVRGFRAGRDLESTIEEFVDKMEADAKAKLNAPPPPNPELQAKQLELQMAQAKSQAEVQKAQTDAQASAADNQRDIAAKAADARNEAAQNAMEMERMRTQAQFDAQSDAFKLRELQMKMAAMEQDHSQTVAQMHAAHAQRMGELGAKLDNSEGPPMEGAQKAHDGKWYVQHPQTKQFYRVDKKAA